jgi:hypothetical protein
MWRSRRNSIDRRTFTVLHAKAFAYKGRRAVYKVIYSGASDIRGGCRIEEVEEVW